MIVKDETILRKVSTDVSSAQEAKDILNDLEKELKKCPNGVGLGAIQIGTPKRVALIIHKGERYELINPTLIEHDEEFLHHDEGCLSIPGTHVIVPRYTQITIENTVLDENAPDGWRRETQVHFVGDDRKTLIPIAIQHEMDHFDGVLITDKEIKLKPIKGGDKIGRNSPCPCGSGKKYKKCCAK